MKKKLLAISYVLLSGLGIQLVLALDYFPFVRDNYWIWVFFFIPSLLGLVGLIITILDKKLPYLMFILIAFWSVIYFTSNIHNFMLDKGGGILIGFTPLGNLPMVMGLIFVIFIYSWSVIVKTVNLRFINISLVIFIIHSIAKITFIVPWTKWALVLQIINIIELIACISAFKFNISVRSIILLSVGITGLFNGLGYLASVKSVWLVLYAGVQIIMTGLIIIYLLYQQRSVEDKNS